MHFSNKVIIFLLGLSLGLLVGAGFFIFKIDQYISRLELFKSTPDTVVTIAKDGDKDKQKSTANKTWQQAKKTQAKDSVSFKNDSAKMVMSADHPDSLKRDSLLVNYTSSQDDIVVKKDELVAATTIDVTTIGAENKISKDSLLQKESGIRDDSKNTASVYQVEFWQSPINYKGYKMMKNKIVLFGIGQNENLKLYRIEDALYMKQQQNVYRLAVTDDFRQFESVKDQSVLVRIK